MPQCKLVVMPFVITLIFTMMSQNCPGSVYWEHAGWWDGPDKCHRWFSLHTCNACNCSVMYYITKNIHSLSKGLFNETKIDKKYPIWGNRDIKKLHKKKNIFTKCVCNIRPTPPRSYRKTVLFSLLSWETFIWLYRRPPHLTLKTCSLTYVWDNITNMTSFPLFCPSHRKFFMD